ncbi:MAG: response regulator [Candidatus Rokubacteria bacterium]|nr:response regulator [Candidatus Rokubacteria bacterium]
MPYPLLALLLVGAAYEVTLLFTSLLAPYRYPIPYAVPIFDGPFAVVGIGVAYLCLERHRLRNDARSAWMGFTLWVTALLAIAHIAAQPDYPGTPGVPAGVAPYFFFLSYIGSFVGIGLAAHAGDRPLRLTERQRMFAIIGGLGIALLLVLAVVRVQGLLPSLVMKPGRLTPFAVWSAGILNGAAALWALYGARRSLGNQRDGFSRLFLLAACIWGIGMLGWLTYPYRYGISWYVGGLARPIGVGLIFVAVLREQVLLYRDARARVRALETLRTFGQHLLQATSEREILADAARTTRELLAADAAAVYLADPKTGLLKLEAGLGWESGIVGVVTVPASAESFAGYSYLHKETVHVADLQDERRFNVPAYLTTHGIRAGTSVPLGLAEEPLGVVAAFYRETRETSDEERRMLASVADQTALALEKARLYAELQANLQRLQETQAQLIQADKLKALGTLLSGMAHELNNPLSTIQLSVQLLKRGETTEPVRRRLDVVEEECERASRIIRDLLVFARRRPPERKRVDLNRVLGGVLKLQGPEFELHRIRVVTELANLPPILGDGHQLQQVFLNLCTNATHAMRSGGGDSQALTIRSRHADGETVVEILDSGPGIPEEHLGRIFDPFFTTKAAGEGTGLGLSLSIGIVQAHGGRMEARNLPGAGACFTVTLPVGDVDSVPETGADDTTQAALRGRVLVVDDETALRTTLAEVLQTFGHTVETSATGQDALTKMEAERFDVVTLDLRLPDIDGKDVWRRVLARDPALASRVIFLTGDTMSPESQKFLQEAARPVLTKPLTLDRVAGLIQEILTANRRPAS